MGILDRHGPRSAPTTTWAPGSMRVAFWVRAHDTASNAGRKPDGMIITTREEVTRGLRRFHVLSPSERAATAASVARTLTEKIAAGYPPAKPDRDFDNDVVTVTLLRFIDGRKIEELLPIYKLGLALPDPSQESHARFGLPDELIVELKLQVQRPPRR